MVVKIAFAGWWELDHAAISLMPFTRFDNARVSSNGLTQPMSALNQTSPNLTCLPLDYKIRPPFDLVHYAPFLTFSPLVISGSGADVPQSTRVHNVIIYLRGVAPAPFRRYVLKHGSSSRRELLQVSGPQDLFIL